MPGAGGSRSASISSMSASAGASASSSTTTGPAGTFSPDGKKLLFTREGPEWWRKGYVGSMASQVWTYDLESKQFEQLLLEQIDHRWPLWKPDGKGIYFCSNAKNGFILNEMPLNPRPVTSRVERQPVLAKTVAAFADDSIVFPCISRDGSTIVFRHLFDFYRLAPGGKPEKIDIFRDDDRPAERSERRAPRSRHFGLLHQRRTGNSLRRRRRPVGHGHRIARAETDHQQCRRGAFPAVRA